MSERNNSYTGTSFKRRFKESETSISSKSKEKNLIEGARHFGFDEAKILNIKNTQNQKKELQNFLNKNYHGEMSWMEDRSEIRSSPKNLWNEAKSILVLASNYHFHENSLSLLNEKDIGIVSVYARGRDYHLTIKKRLKSLSRWISDNYKCNVKYFVDTAPIMEKPLAMKAGIGWQGKHTNIVSKEFGSWLFLSSIFLDIDLKSDNEMIDHCGSCQRCIDICPTNAIESPYQINASKCISYLTIEHKSHIPELFRKKIGNRVYGCDDCLAVCPWNKYAKKTNNEDFFPRKEFNNPKLKSFLKLDDDGFRKLFSTTSIKRIGRNRFLRNVLIAVGNSGDDNFINDITPLLHDNSHLVRAMAVWSLSQLCTKKKFEKLKKSYLHLEIDKDVIKEWNFI